jgi:hypothetical protein
MTTSPDRPARPRFRTALAALACCSLIHAALADDELPETWTSLFDEDHRLPRYEERYYHPLGRNAAVDAVLADPLYLPRYALDVSAALRAAAGSGSTLAVLEAALRAGGVPILGDVELDAPEIPDLRTKLGGQGAEPIEEAWAHLLEARRLATEALAGLSDDDRAEILAHPDAWFYGEGRTIAEDDLPFFTTDTTAHLRLFRFAATIDIAALAHAQRHLAAAIDVIEERASYLRRLDIAFEYEQDGLVLRIVGRRDDRHELPADLLIDLGGNDVYLNAAGGTLGVTPAALVIDLDGDDRYDGAFACQGAGVLGAGALADLRGNDWYDGYRHVQAAAYFGAGLLVDRAGDDRYRAGHMAQSAAVFGTSLLWDGAGYDQYDAQSVAQAASSTLGVAVLVESAGDDIMTCGGPRDPFWSPRLGIGQGGASGLRDYPWKEKPSFYGGVAFLDDADGSDRYAVPAFGLGGGYVLGLGVHVNSGGNDQFIGQSETLGAVVHLAAGCFIKHRGDDRYDGGWGSLGIGGDRGVGFFFDTAGDDRYVGAGHSIGAARKPKALGLFIDAAGNDRYAFTDESCARLIRPTDPEDWAHARFLDLQGSDAYPGDDDELDRGNNTVWTFGPTAVGEDVQSVRRDSADDIIDSFPEANRAGIPFDPVEGWDDNTTHRPLTTPDWPRPPAPDAVASEDDVTPQLAMEQIDLLLDGLSSDSFDARRDAIERLDLARFLGIADELQSRMPGVFAYPLDGPDPADEALAWAAVWAELDQTLGADLIAPLLMDGRPTSNYVRRLLIRALGESMPEGALPLLVDRLASDADPLCRREAARYLGEGGADAAQSALAAALTDPEAVVRISACRGLRDSTVPTALPAVIPLLADEDLYVRRAAAVTAISLGHVPAVRVLLDTMQTPTLDTTENYGNNLYDTLADYLGPDLYDELGLDLAAWTTWWDEQEKTFDLPAALEDRRVRLAAEEAEADENEG